MRQLRKPQRRERMRRDHVDARVDVEARRRGFHDERADALRAGRVGLAREHGVEIGDAAVGDPGLGAVEHDPAVLLARAGGHRRDVRARVGLGQRERGDGLAARHARQELALQRRRSGQRDRARAEALHGEREVREALVPREGLADDAQAARVERVAASAVQRGHAVLEPARLRRAGRPAPRRPRRRRRGRGRRGCAPPTRRARARACDARRRRTASRGSWCRPSTPGRDAWRRTPACVRAPARRRAGSRCRDPSS